MKTSGQDPKTVAAVERKLQLISEAAIRLGEEAERLCPGPQWRNIRGLGNWLRHQYDRIDLETIWRTVSTDLPSLWQAVDSAILRSRSLPAAEDPGACSDSEHKRHASAEASWSGVGIGRGPKLPVTPFTSPNAKLVLCQTENTPLAPKWRLR